MPHKALGILHNGPDVHTASYHGKPQMEPESESSGTETLSGGNRTTLVGSQTGGGPGSSGTSPAVVETVKPGDPTPAKAEDTGTVSTGDANTAETQDSAASSTNSSSDAAKTDAAATNGAASDSTKAATTDGNSGVGKESSSKKKGLKKIIPW